MQAWPVPPATFCSSRKPSSTSHASACAAAAAAAVAHRPGSNRCRHCRAANKTSQVAHSSRPLASHTFGPGSAYIYIYKHFQGQMCGLLYISVSSASVVALSRRKCLCPTTQIPTENVLRLPVLN
jgi:hypothetical protein